MNLTPYIVPAFLVVDGAGCVEPTTTPADLATERAADFANDVNRWSRGEPVERLSSNDLGIRLFLDEAMDTVPHPNADGAGIGTLLSVDALALRLQPLGNNPLTGPLCELFERWLDRHPHLPRRSADELLYEHPDLPTLTAAERAWLATFERLWELCQADEDKRELSGAYLMQAFHAEPIAPNRDANDDVPGMSTSRGCESLQDVLAHVSIGLDNVDRSLERAHCLAVYHAPIGAPTTLRAIDQLRTARATVRDLHLAVTGHNRLRVTAERAELAAQRTRNGDLPLPANAPHGPWDLAPRPGGAHWLVFGSAHVGVLRQAHPRTRELIVGALNRLYADAHDAPNQPAPVEAHDVDLYAHGTDRDSGREDFHADG